MAEGNGVDLGSIAQMLRNLIVTTEQLQIGQDQLRVGQDQLRHEMRTEFVAVRAEIGQLRAETRAEFKDMREHLNLVHGSVIGHGIAITELQDDVRDIKAHVGLPPRAA